MKQFILSLDDFLVNYPKSEKILKDKIKSTSYEVQELSNITKMIYGWLKSGKC